MSDPTVDIDAVKNIVTVWKAGRCVQPVTSP